MKTSGGFLVMAVIFAEAVLSYVARNRNAACVGFTSEAHVSREGLAGTPCNHDVIKQLEAGDT